MAGLSVEALLVRLAERAEAARLGAARRRTAREELRSLGFWRAIIAECLASFFYVFVVCGAHVNWPGYQPSSLTIALASGLAMATLGHCFAHISGAHANPAVTLAAALARKISPLRAVLYITAQCGGAIAGAALLYGVTIPGYQGTLGSSAANEALGPWQAFGIEFVLSFVVVFAVFATLDPNRRGLGGDSMAVGMAYLACSLPGVPSSGASMNPARSLGPAFVMNRWTNHWVYWCAPLTGGPLAGLIYEYIFDTKKVARTLREALDEVDKESTAEEDYEEPAKGTVARSGGQTGPQYDAYRPAINTYSPTPSAAATSGYPHADYTPGQLYYTRYATMRAAPSRMEYSATAKF